MSKVTLSDLASLANETSAIATINDNSDLIEAAFDNTLSRDGSTPNSMESSLDMNSNRILNLPAPGGVTEPVRVQELADLAGGSVTINNSFVQNTYERITDHGAIDDGDIANAGVNYLAVVAALATGKTVWIPWTASGYHFGTHQITVADNQTILGENGVKLKSTATTSLFYLTASETTSSPTYLDNLKIDMTGSGAGSCAILYATSLGSVAGTQISRMIFTNCVKAIGCETHATRYITDCKFYDIRCELTRGEQIYIPRSRGYLWWEGIRIDENIAGQITSTWNGARFEDIIGLTIKQFYHTGPVGTGVYQSGKTGLTVKGLGSGLSSLWLDDVLVDSSSGNGVDIEDVNLVTGNFIRTYANLGYGFKAKGLSVSSFTNLSLRGANDVSGASATKDGALFTGCSQLTVCGIGSYNNTGHGISVVDTVSSSITGINSTNNTLYGLSETGTSDLNVFNGANFFTNTSGSHTLTGASSSVVNEIDAGTHINATSPTFKTSIIGSLGGTSNLLAGSTSNYNVFSLNNNKALASALGIFGGASGDASTLYLSAPSFVTFYLSGTEYYRAGPTYFRPNVDNAYTLGDATHRFSTGYLNGLTLMRGANGSVGTFVCNGTTPVTVSNTSVAVTDAIIISLNTVGGTVGALPAIKTITASTGFTVAGTASDTSTYNYAIIKNIA